MRDPSKVVWLSQTTLSVDETMETVRRLRERFPNLQDPPTDDICYATQNRQVAIKKVAQDADLVIVVGSANSSNSVRLVEVALEYGAKAAYRVDYATEVEQEWLDGVATVGVTSGASVPEVLVKEVLDDLADAGYGDVDEVKTAEEDLMFSLPKELRRMSAATATTAPSAGGAAHERLNEHPDLTAAPAVRRIRDARGAARSHPSARCPGALDAGRRTRRILRRPAARRTIPADLPRGRNPCECDRIVTLALLA